MLGVGARLSTASFAKRAAFFRGAAGGGGSIRPAVTPGLGGTRQLRQHAFTFITFTFTFAFKIYISGIQHLHLTRWVRVRVRVRVKVSFLAQQSSGSTPTSTGASEGVDTEPKDNPSLTLARVHSSAEGKQTELGLCGDCE